MKKIGLLIISCMIAFSTFAQTKLRHFTLENKTGYILHFENASMIDLSVPSTIGPNSQYQVYYIMNDHVSMPLAVSFQLSRIVNDSWNDMNYWQPVIIVSGIVDYKNKPLLYKTTIQNLDSSHLHAVFVNGNKTLMII